MDALPAMSWRRFRVLLSGLGPNSALVAHLSARKRPGKRGTYATGSPEVVIDADRNPAEFDSFWKSMTRPAKRRRQQGQ